MPLNSHVSNCTDVRRYDARASAIGSSGVVPMTRAAVAGVTTLDTVEVRRPRAHRSRSAAAAWQRGRRAPIDTDGGDVRTRTTEASRAVRQPDVGRATRVTTLASTKRPRSRWSSLRSAPLPDRYTGAPTGTCEPSRTDTTPGVARVPRRGDVRRRHAPHPGESGPRRPQGWPVRAAPMWHGRQIRAVGLDQQPVRGAQISRRVADGRGALERHDATKARKAPRSSARRASYGPPVKQWKTSRGDAAGGEHRERLLPRPASVDDQWQSVLGGEGDLGGERLTLGVPRRVDVVVVETALPDRDGVRVDEVDDRVDTVAASWGCSPTVASTPS